jgi:two-component system, LytTR family, response regulator
MVKIMVVDDEILAVKTLTVMVNKYVDGEKDVRGESDFHTAISTIKSFKPDVLILDVMMTPYSGFDLLSQLDDKNFSIIFATAFDHFAINAIKHSALDYLLKPINAEELKHAFQKHFDQVNRLKNLQHEHLLENLNHKNKQNFTIAIPTIERTFFIKPQELIRCESESNYTWFYLKDGTKILASKTMKYYESVLLEYDFDRVHKSHLVNKHYMAAKGKGDTVILKDETVLPVSRGKKIEILR